MLAIRKNVFLRFMPMLWALAIMSGVASAQVLLNEVESDPPVDVGDRCQYVEILGTPNSTVPANTYFISINSDQDNFGFLNAAVNIGGVQIGANGTLTLVNSQQGTCPNRTYDAGTHVFSYSAITSLGQGSEGFYIVSSSTTLLAGTDLDVNDNGIVDPLDVSFAAGKSGRGESIGSPFQFIDGINYIFNPEEQFAYGPAPNLVEVLFGDVPDAATRFAGNSTPNSASAWYFGELATSPEETTTYAAPFSTNFPSGGALTPGAPNNGSVVTNGDGRADFDGDGRTDVSVFRPSEGNWYINGSSAGFFVLNFGISTDHLAPGDFDGDGKDDTAVFRPSDTAGTPDWWILGSDGFIVSGAEWGSTGDVPVVADYDGDGKDDIAVWRDSNASLYVIKSSGGSTSSVVGGSGDTPLAGDFDGDGTADPTTFNNGTWTSLLSGGGTEVVSLGASGDQLVHGDYDGDGQTDQAAFASDGTWTIKLSSTGSVTTVDWGTAGDVAAPGDYDGDGTDDTAIYRGGQWWINGSTSGVSVQSFGLATDKAVPASANP
ncbi:MAG: VCBS repeat-containing protein [Pyrinomonadaceae bacterium]